MVYMYRDLVLHHTPQGRPRQAFGVGGASFVLWSIAYDDQVIVFRCITRSTILVWQSDDYIGPIADGRDLRLHAWSRD